LKILSNIKFYVVLLKIFVFDVHFWLVFEGLSELRQPKISETRENEKFRKTHLSQGLTPVWIGLKRGPQFIICGSYLSKYYKADYKVQKNIEDIFLARVLKFINPALDPKKRY
jgi:hypothetical protein